MPAAHHNQAPPPPSPPHARATATTTITFTATAPAGATVVLRPPVPAAQPTTGPPLPPYATADTPLEVTHAVAVVVDNAGATEAVVTLVPGADHAWSALTAPPTPATGPAEPLPPSVPLGPSHVSAPQPPPSVSGASEGSGWDAWSGGERAQVVALLALVVAALVAVTVAGAACVRRWRDREEGWRARRAEEKRAQGESEAHEAAWRRKVWVEGALTRAEFWVATARAATVYKVPDRGESLRSVVCAES